MEFMLDTLNLDEIKKWSEILPLAGVTSNPTIAKREGSINFFERIKDVRELIGSTPSIHVQVISQDFEGILKDAHEIRRQAGDDIFIKVPVTPAGLRAIKVLKKEGYHITATAIYTVIQGLLAIEAGADYLAPYYNRMENLNIDSNSVIRQLALLLVLRDIFRGKMPCLKMPNQFWIWEITRFYYAISWFMILLENDLKIIYIGMVSILFWRYLMVKLLTMKSIELLPWLRKKIVIVLSVLVGERRLIAQKLLQI